MFGRKKYRKGKSYFYVTSGQYSSGNHPGVQDRVFLNSNAITLTHSLTASEMFKEILWHVKKAQGVEQDHQVFLTSYHVESE